MSLLSATRPVLSLLSRNISHFPSLHRSSSRMAQSSLFTGAVVSAMRRLYPEELADKSFDNTGLLLEAPYLPNAPRKTNSVLLTIDLTTAVADEAIAGNFSVVVAYHPIIFRGIKSITLDDTQQASLLRLAANGTSVYSPHTAVDIVPGGMADWLCDIVTGNGAAQDESVIPEHAGNSTKATAQGAPAKSAPGKTTGTYTSRVVTPSPDSAITSANKAHQPSALNAGSEPYNTSNTGAGRLITLEQPQPLSDLVNRIASATGNPKAIQIAIPQTKSINEISIKTVGLCPGSGSSVLRAATPAPDLIFTGELSHHEALAVIERGGVVIALGHSNSERGYLSSVMKSILTEEVKREWDRVRKTALSSDTQDQSIKEMLADGSVEVAVSTVDRDPFGTVVLENT